MAEINIERKNRAYLWQLIIALVVIGLVIWAGIELFDRDSEMARDKALDAPEVAPTTKVVIHRPIPLDKYITFIRDNPAQEKMELDHAYTSGGIRRLADAIGAVADQYNLSNLNQSSDLDKLRDYADRLQEDRNSTDHADVIREAFILASSLMDSMQRQISPQLDSRVGEVRRAAEAIDPGELALQQKTEVETFFNKAGSVLEDLAKRNT